MRGPLLVLVLVTATYVGLCLMAFLFQKRLTFFPERRLAASPSDTGLRYEEVSVETEDRVQLHAWWVPHPEARGVILFFHGNAGNMSHRLDTLRFWNELGFSILIFDYRGYGHSGGQISEAGTQADARAMWRYLTEVRGHAPGEIVLFGRSLGAAVAIELATHVRSAGLIVESAFTTMADMARRAYPWLPVRWLLRMRFDSLNRIRRIDAPKLFVHSTDDEMVPYDMGRTLFEAASGPKQFLPIVGTHGDGWLRSGVVYRDGVAAFVATLPLP